jgi:hypothetical protein
MRPRVPGIKIQSVNLDIGNDHLHLFVSLTFESNTGLSADNAMTAVATGLASV